MSYILRGDVTQSELWKQFKARADAEGRSLKWLILELIRRYVEKGLD